MLRKLIRSVDPRLSLAARVAWVSGGLTVIFSLLAGVYVGSLSETVIEREIGALYSGRAQHIADAIDLKVQSDFSTMRVAAGVLRALSSAAEGGSERKLVDTIRQNLVGAIWIGVVDRSGTVVAGDNGLLEGTNFSREPWFVSAQRGVSFSGPEEFPILEKRLRPLPNDNTRKFTLITAPMTDENGAAAGFSVVSFDTDWIYDIQKLAGKPLETMRPVEVFLFDENGELVTTLPNGTAPPGKELRSRIDFARNSDRADQDLGSLTTHNYLVGYAKSRGYLDFKGTGWTVVIREAKKSAFIPAYRAAVAIALSCLVLGIGLSLAVAFGTKYVLRGLAAIAASADSLRKGHSTKFPVDEGMDEVARISRTVASLFNSLQTTNENLAELNRNLDRKVTERTREVQRLSEETKTAAITRERLQLARDLHDTLAHTMLAMLTQIRLMQKLIKSRPELIEAELGHAEEAAKEGLVQARQAVTKLRYFAVRDDGLGQALKKLVTRIQERGAIEANINIDDAASLLAGTKSEIVYRIAEEALHNVERHSNANRLSIVVDIERNDPADLVLRLVIEDDGTGFDPLRRRPGHYGLVGMQEQAELLDGKLNIQSTVGGGTSIHLEVPL